MRRILVFAVLIAAVTMLTAVSVTGAVGGMNPAEVVEAVYAAVEAGEVETVGAMLAEDAVLTLVPAPEGMDGTFVGKDEVMGWFESLSAENGRFEFSDVKTDGNTATMRLVFHSDFFDNAVGGPAKFDGTAVVQDGLWKSVSWVFTPDFSAEMDAAMARQANYVVIERYFNDLWSQGELNVVDEIISEDFVSHTFPQGEGRDGMREMVTGFRDAFPGVTIVLDQVAFDNNRAFVLSRMVGPDGTSATSEGDIEDIIVFELEDGQITDRWYFVPPPE